MLTLIAEKMIGHGLGQIIRGETFVSELFIGAAVVEGWWGLRDLGNIRCESIGLKLLLLVL